MKNIAALAVALSLLGSNAVLADGQRNKQAAMTLAFNTTINEQWSAQVKTVNTTAINKSIELKLSQKLETMSLALDKQLEEKLAQEFAYDAQ